MLQLPLIPFVTSYIDVTFFFFIFARCAGIFIVSPILGSRLFIPRAKIMVSVFISILLLMTLYPKYLGANAIFHLAELDPDANIGLLQLFLMTARELAIGYLIGFCFILILEALMIAGQTVGVLVGFSAAEMLDPISNTTQSLIGQLFVITVTVLMLALDMHHEFFRLLAYSFDIIPIGNYNYPEEMQKEVLHGTGRMFNYAIQFAAIPYVTLFLVTAGLGFMSKVMPEMNIFIVGFPLKILVGYYTLILTVTYLPITLKTAFREFHNLSINLIHHIGS